MKPDAPEAVSPAPAETVSGAALISDLPPINAAAVAAVDASAAPSPAPAAAAPDLAGETDKLGRPFDAAKFRPELDSLGRWKNLRGGRKPGGTNKPRPDRAPLATGSTIPLDFKPAAPPTAAPSTPSTPPPPAAPAVDFDATADAYLAIGYLAADALLVAKGEWQPESATEHNQLRDALSAYLRSKGAQPVNPLTAFLIASGRYCWKRIRLFNTSAAIAKYSPTLARWLGIKVETTAAKNSPAAEPVSAPAAASPANPFASGGLPRP